MVVGLTNAYALGTYRHWCCDVRLPLRARCTTLCDKVCQWLGGFFHGPLVSFANKTDRHDIDEILLKVPLSTINYTSEHVMHMYLINRAFAHYQLNSKIKRFYTFRLQLFPFIADRGSHFMQNSTEIAHVFLIICTIF
jgi:hypothetical protein